MPLPTEQEDTVFLYFIGEKTSREFENYVYSATELEQFVGANDYLKLISIDFEANSAKYEVEKILNNHLDPNRFIELTLRSILNRIVDRSKCTAGDILETYYLYCDGYEFLNGLGLKFGLAVAAPEQSSSYEWDGLSEQKQHIILDNFYPEVQTYAQRVLTCFDEKSIVFNLDKLESFLFGILPRNPAFVDSRTSKMKELMGR